MSQETSDYWKRQHDNYVDKYRNPENILHYEKRHRLDRAIALAEFPDVGAVVDVGVGAGEFFTRVRGDTRFVGLDFARPMLKAARSRAPHPEYVQGTVNRLPLFSESAGSLFCLGVLGHLDRRQVPDAMSELSRILAPGGELLLSFANANSPFRKLRSLYTDSLAGESTPYDVYKPREIEASFRKHGLRVKARRYLTYSPGMGDVRPHIELYKLLDEHLDETDTLGWLAMTHLLRFEKSQSMGTT